MIGQMMRMPLLTSSLLVHADRHHGDTSIVSRRVEGDVHRYTYADCHRRTRQLANALVGLGVRASQRIGSLAWNGYRHLELMYGVGGRGAVLHTLNPLCHPDSLVAMLDQAQDEYFFFDLSFVPIVQALAHRTQTVKAFVAMTDRSHMPSIPGVANLLCYEDLLDGHSDSFSWPLLDENMACSLAHTSGTTGQAKGVLYSHRSTLLQAFAAALPDAMHASARDAMLTMAPMFHAQAWGLPYIGPLVGAKLVLPGPLLDGRSLYELSEAEKVRFAAGTPIVWQGVLEHMRQNQLRFSTLRRVLIGGAACPQAMTEAFQNQYGVEVLHAWGMTETSALGTICPVEAKPQQDDAGASAKAGGALYGIDRMLRAPNGEILPWDGQSTGELLVRGHWVAAAYFAQEAASAPYIDSHGQAWLATGDLATIDTHGVMRVKGRVDPT